MNNQISPATTGSQAQKSHLYAFFDPIRAYLEDEEVSEVLINGPRQIYIERKGRLEKVPSSFISEQALLAAVTNVARSIGRLFNKENPRLDARLPDGSRVHAVLPPLARTGTAVAIRKFSREKLSVERLLALGSVTEGMARLLEGIVFMGRNLIVSGATSSGKTSVLNVLSAMIPENERILVLEDSSELQLQQAHTVCFETRKPDEYGQGEVTITHLLHSSLRLRPDRIVIGEIRGAEALDLLQAMNTGHDGTMSTIHANTPYDSLVRLENCAMQNGLSMPQSALRSQVASAVQIVIQTARLCDGSRKITHISEVLPIRNGDYHCEDIVRFEETGPAVDGRIQGGHLFTGYIPSFIAIARKRGLDMDSLFQSR